MTKKSNESSMVPRFTLRSKLNILFLTISGLLIITFSYTTINVVRYEVKEQAELTIKKHSELVISLIEVWKIRNEGELFRLSDPNSTLINSLTEFLNDQSENNKEKVRNELDRSLFNAANYVELFVMDPNSGEVLISSNPNSEGKMNTGHDSAYQRADGARISPIHFSKHLNDYTICVENPVKNNFGETILVIGANTNILALRSALAPPSITHQAGKAYLVSLEGKAIIGDYIAQPNMIQRAIDGDITVTEYINSEQKKVTGYQEYLPDLQAVLIHEHESSKLFASLAVITKSIWTIAFSILAATMLVIYFLINRFTKPIIDLTKTAQKIAMGNYKVRARIKSTDEIGVLSHDFNSMTDELVSSLEEVSLKNALLQSQYDSALYGIFSISSKGKVLSWNRSYKELWDIPKSLKNCTDPHIFIRHCAEKTKDPENFIKKTKKLVNLKKGTSHETIELTNGQIINRQSAPLLGEKGAILGRVFLLRDVTKETKMSMVKNEFISLATHQLQTPLTAIRWLLEELGNLEKNNKKKYQLVKDASVSTERVIRLVSDLLNVSRLDVGQIGINSKKVELTQLVSDLINKAKTTAKAKKITIGFERSKTKIFAYVDKDLISEVVLNILSNAIRYSEPKKKITVRIRKRKSSVEISIKDQGIGISKEDQKELFTKFFRTNEAGRYNTTGSGLGLYIIKKILDACKANIKIESELGKGSTFKIILPLKGPVLIKEGAKVLIRKGMAWH